MKQYVKVIVQTLSAAIACGGGYIAYLGGREIYAAISSSRFVLMDSSNLVYLALLLLGVIPVLLAYSLLNNYSEKSIQNFCVCSAIICCMALLYYDNQIAAAIRLRGLNTFENQAALYALTLMSPYIFYRFLYRLLKKYSL